MACKYFNYSLIHSFIQQMCIDYVTGTILGFLNTIGRERHDSWCHRTCTPREETDKTLSSKGNNLI